VNPPFKRRETPLLSRSGDLGEAKGPRSGDEGADERVEVVVFLDALLQKSIGVAQRAAALQYRRKLRATMTPERVLVALSLVQAMRNSPGPDPKRRIRVDLGDQRGAGPIDRSRPLAGAKLRLEHRALMARYAILSALTENGVLPHRSWTNRSVARRSNGARGLSIPEGHPWPRWWATTASTNGSGQPKGASIAAFAILRSPKSNQRFRIAATRNLSCSSVPVSTAAEHPDPARTVAPLDDTHCGLRSLRRQVDPKGRRRADRTRPDDGKRP